MRAVIAVVLAAFAQLIVAESEHGPREITLTASGCSRLCIKLTATAGSHEPDLGSACAPALAAFREDFAPDLQTAISYMMDTGALPQAIQPDMWLVTRCNIRKSKASSADPAKHVYATEVELCGPVARDVGILVSRAIASYGDWQDYDLDIHAKRLSGFQTMPLADCLSWNLSVHSPTDSSPACAASVDSPCYGDPKQYLRSSSLPLDASQASSQPGNQPAADHRCDRLCMKWRAQQDNHSSMFVRTDASSDCSPALNALTRTFGASLQRILQAQATSKQLDQSVVDAFVADLDSFKVERCRAGASADGKFNHVLIAICGRLSASGEAEALSKALQYTDDTMPTWQGSALYMTGFTSGGSSTCSNLAFEAVFSSGSGWSEEKCTGLRTGWSANSCPTDASHLRMDGQAFKRRRERQ